jgi:adenylate cyclase
LKEITKDKTTMDLSSHLSQDRLRAIANNTILPDRTSGSALFGDISGFTALTESLQREYGARRGSEELSEQLEAVYSALIAEIEKFGGSVISFAGDSMLCWFDEVHGKSAPRAVACAFAMQEAMRLFETFRVRDDLVTLTLKAAVATGPARRFVAGDPDIQKLDALAGDTVTRTSTAEHHAQKGEVLLDEASVNALGESLKIQEWRTAETSEKFAVASKSDWQFDLQDLQPSLPTMLRMPPPNKLMPWMHYAIFEREQHGQGAFLTEFRPCVALFMRFTGIDYDSDSAESELDAFIREVQRIASRYDGTLMDITIGDKGSYVYVNFGALAAHEDDSRRAVKAALEIRNKTELQLQMGITQGLMRVGAYGGETRKVFGALGDDVNLAARLMTTASSGEILLSGHVHKAVIEQFTFEPRSPLPMKGKAEPLPVFAVTGESQKRAVRLQEPNYFLPMVGRMEELKLIEEKLDLAVEGKSQVVAVVAEAGLGKSRLVAEVIRSARKKGFIGYGGACQSDAIHTPYQAWKSIWQAFFDVDHEQPLRKQMRNLESEIEDRASSRAEAMPLLNVVLDLNIPENDFTQNLEPKIRQSALHALLEDCMKAAAKDEPLLIVIEDLHWIDALSHDLLEQLAKALANYAVCFVLAYRPPQLERLQAPHIEALEQFTKIELHELTQAEAESAIRAKLAQLYPARGGALPSGLVDALMRRAQGNPFYLEELLNYVRDRGLDPADLNRIELPDSLHTLILSRIDQLSGQEKTTLRVASIVGRLFRARWLTGYYPELGAFPVVKASLDTLNSLDITPLDSPEPDLAYLFKHILTHEVTYESLPFATRAKLHEQLARYLEKTQPEALPLETLAFHYGRSENKAKQMEYLRKAGEAAQKNFANDAALGYYGKLLPLLKDANAQEKIAIHLQRGQVIEFIGKWDDAESDYRAALELARDNASLKAGAQFALGRLNRLRGEFESALDWLAQAKEAHMALEDKAGLAQVLIETGMVLNRTGKYAQAREPLNAGLALAREAGDKLGAAQALNNLGNVANNQGDNNVARALYEESLSLRREMGDKAGISASLSNLGIVARSQGDAVAARALTEESLSLDRAMGDKWGIAASLNNLGLVAYHEGDYTAARSLYKESLTLGREMGDKVGIATSLNNLGIVARSQGDYAAARALYEESLSLRREMGDKAGIAASLNNLGLVTHSQGDDAAARALLEESLALSKEMDVKSIMAYALFGLGLVGLAENKPEARKHILHSLRLRQETGEQAQQTYSLVGVAGLALSEGNATQAAQWLGAVESALKALSAAMEVEVMHFHAQTLAAAREQLGEVGFQSAWEQGARWSLEEAVMKALE